MRVRIPVGDELTRSHLLIFFDAQNRTIGNLVALALSSELVDDGELAGTRRDDEVLLLLMLHGLHVVHSQCASAFDFDAVDRRRTRCGTTDVERAHRELRARLTDRLRGDDAHGLALVDAMATAEITTVTLGTHAVTCFARDW